MSFFLIKASIFIEEQLTQIDLYVDIKFQASSYLYFPLVTDYLSLFTIIDLLGEVCKRPYGNTHFLLYKLTS